MTFVGRGRGGGAADCIGANLLHLRICLRDCCQHLSSILVFIQYNHKLESVIATEAARN